jgi:hypothetical protein
MPVGVLEQRAWPRVRQPAQPFERVIEREPQPLQPRLETRRDGRCTFSFSIARLARGSVIDHALGLLGLLLLGLTGWAADVRKSEILLRQTLDVFFAPQHETHHASISKTGAWLDCKPLRVNVRILNRLDSSEHPRDGDAE